MSHNSQLAAVIASVRPALNSAPTNAAERAQLVYDLVHEVYDHVKFDLHAPTEDTDERAQLGRVLDAALPEVRPVEYIVDPKNPDAMRAAVESLGGEVIDLSSTGNGALDPLNIDR